MNAVTDYDIQALVDNELDDEKAEQVCIYIEKSPHAQKRYQELIRQTNLLKSWWADPEFPKSE